MENISPDESQDLRLKAEHAGKLLATNGTEYTSVSIANQNFLVENAQSFFEGIGQMTRMIHSATRSLDELQSREVTAEIPILERQPQDNFLKYVKELTAHAASKVLDNLEQVKPIIDTAIVQNEQLSDDISSLRQADESTKTSEAALKLFDRVQNHLDQNTASMEKLAASHSEILMLQSYQDLTSQAIIKAETLLSEVESTLAELLKSFSNMDDTGENTDDTSLAANSVEGEIGSQSELPAEEQLGQDDVDSLLSQLGF